MKTITIQVPDWVDENLIKELVLILAKYEKRKAIREIEKIKRYRGIFGKASYKELREIEGEIL